MSTESSSGHPYLQSITLLLLLLLTLTLLLPRLHFEDSEHYCEEGIIKEVAMLCKKVYHNTKSSNLVD